VVLNRGSAPPHEGTKKLQRSANPYAPYDMEGLIIKFANKYVCFYRLFKARVLETKHNIRKGGVVEKRLRTTVVDLCLI